MLVVGITSESDHERQKRSPDGYGKPTYHKPSKKCYQCAYSPPKTVYEKVKHGYGYGHGGGGYDTKKATIRGGWDKCLGPFDHYQAKAYGIDVWDCHYNNCYIRKDYNGDIIRGCYKGEFGVDQHRYGCSYQGGSTYCFCEGELCNNGPAPH